MKQDRVHQLVERLNALANDLEAGRQVWIPVTTLREVVADLVKLTHGQEPCGWMRIVQGHTSFVVAEVEWGFGMARPDRSGLWMPLYAHPIPSQQEDRVRELEKVLDVALGAMKKAVGRGNLCSWPEWEGLMNACAVIAAARSKEQEK